jgi:hypothetical protein
LDSGNALGNRNPLHLGAAAFVNHADAFAASDFFFHAGQFQPRRLAAAVALISALTASVGGSAAAAVSQTKSRGTEKCSGKDNTKSKLGHQFVSETGKQQVWFRCLEQNHSSQA